MKPRKPRVLWAFYDSNGCLGEVSASRKRVIQIAYASRYNEGGKAVKFVEAPSKPVVLWVVASEDLRTTHGIYTTKWEAEQRVTATCPHVFQFIGTQSKKGKSR